MKHSLVLLSFFVLFHTCICFHEVPHMLILGIAKRELMKNDQEIYKITAKYLDTFSASGIETISTTSYEENAVWGDDIKTYGDAQKAMGMWHFIGNKDSNPENLTLVKDPMADSENALNAYDNIVKTFKNKSFIGKITEFKIMMLKMLVHLVGDIHMPHHTGSYYNSTIVGPNKEIWGDRGGNRQKIKFYTSTGKKESTDIHFYFDSSCFYYNWKSRLQRPLNDTFKAYFEAELDRIMTQYPKETLNINNAQTFNDWAEESWNIALTEVYPFLLKNNEIRFGDAFYNSSFDMIQKRIVIAGYRLAYTLQNMFAAEKGKIDLSTPLTYEISQKNPLDNGDKSKDKDTTVTDNKDKPIDNNKDKSTTDNKDQLPNNNKDNTPVINNNNKDTTTTPDKEKLVDNNQDKNTDSYSNKFTEDLSNKAIAVVFGVLFGLTFFTLVALMIYFHKTVTSLKSHHRVSTDFQEAKTLNMQRIPSTEQNENKL
ncbi:P1/s1 nuclease (macronuclear) [Tetrahymena thermophila SB210]|uniref:P1/s1 nuclease n=1 Tax=Tetrahymena thermophila (strain SB210) TaxID=312017 RepID=I7LU48_TETTS|nr:P1/s1 nuclease [Tetrahymena thermophila SB210]EAR89888.1 P1/s1 nuclease [Tetrahymena thermophila SB210]|eukprot:XP_001010133.1 P1/s1 nuclease [Tetrahymena thermophila SB210]